MVDHTPAPKAVEALHALANEIAAAVLADEADGGCDISAGMFGPAFSAIVRHLAAAQAEQATEWPKLDKPAKIGGGTFGVGVSAEHVVRAAQAAWHRETPEELAARIEAGEPFLAVLQGRAKIVPVDAAQAEQAKPEAPELLLSDLRVALAALYEMTDDEGKGVARVAIGSIDEAMAALSPQPPSPDVERQAVVWQLALDLGRWVNIAAAEVDYFRRQGRKVRGLYAHPLPEAGDANADLPDDVLDRLLTDIGEDAECFAKHWGLPKSQFPLYRQFIRAAIAARSPQQEPKA